MKLFKRFYISLFTPKRYKELIRTSGISAFFYLLILSLLLGLLAFSKNYTELNKFLISRKYAFEDKIPPFEIKDGVLDLKDSNFVVFQEENWTFILNDKEPAKDLLKDYESGIAFGNESLIIKYDNNKITETNYSSINLSLNDNDLKNSINSLEKTFGNTYLSLMVIVFIAFSYIVTLILAIITKFICRIRNNHVSFGEIMKISTYGITPCLVLLALLNLTSLNIIISFSLSFLVSIIYVYFGIDYLNKYNFK
ncbi:DUF1189 domain-containing protein [Clostridium sp.]|uniref:DUF1189 domain-containing protein n=1 Tax=Clostridium sp. TaxID=1506 RepID=UPI002628BD32